MSDLFGGKLPIPIDAQIRIVEREIRMREEVYPRRVADGKMTLAKLNAELEGMRAVLQTLHRVASEVGDGR